jgi:multidrug efflux pump subunit AcrA (membrane-fusion protein)
MSEPNDNRTSFDKSTGESNSLFGNDRQHPSDSPNLDPRITLSIIGLLLLLIAAGVAFWVWRLKHPADSTEQKDPVVVSVKVAKAEREDISAQVSALGTIFPRDQAVVSAKIGAQIKKMSLLKNRVVKAGEVIATLEARDLLAQRGEAQAALVEAEANARSVTTGTIPQTNAQDQKALRDARANVTAAQATYNRRKVLFEQGGISKKDLEASEVALITAQSDLKLAEQTIELRAKSLNPNDRAMAASKVNQAQQHLSTLDAQLSYATVRAPFTGVITEQFQFEGEYAASGAKLVSIADTSEVIVKAPFADTVAAQLKVGDTASVIPADSPDDKMAGKISLISKSSDPVNRTVEVWVNLGNEAGKLKANGAAQVVVNAQSASDAVVVPTAAVTLDATNADEGTVMIVDATSIAHEQKVKVGVHSGDKLEITSGLNGGETVVTEGNYALPDGSKVEVSEEKDTQDSDKAKGDEP